MRPTRKQRLVKQSVVAALDRFNLSAVVRDRYNAARYGLDVAQRVRNTRFRRQGAPDGLPLPPAHLVYLVSGQYDLELFCRIGVTGVQSIRQMLAQNGLAIEQFAHVLDFGCGCGRIMRHWSSLSGPTFSGSDYNPALITWCQANLPFATFAVNDSSAGLRYSDGAFDFAYAISVFTHLDEPDQHYWLGELGRVLKPGGYLLLTTHGATRLHEIPPDMRERYQSGQVVALRSQHSGDNVCKVFHPEPYVRRLADQTGFAVMAYMPGAARDANQDGYLLRRIDAHN